MTRPEITGERKLGLSTWIRARLPDSSTGFCVSNQDWLLWNWKTRRLMLCEEKTHGATLAPWFRKFIFEVMEPALAEYCKGHNIDFRGYHIITLEKESPQDGWIQWDGVDVTESELVRLLSLTEEAHP